MFLGLNEKVEILEMLQVLIEEQNEMALCLIRGFGFYIDHATMEDLEAVRDNWTKEMGDEWDLLIRPISNAEGMYHVQPTQMVLVAV